MVDYEDAHLLNMIHQNSKRDQPKWLGDSLLKFHYKALVESALIYKKVTLMSPSRILGLLEKRTEKIKEINQNFSNASPSGMKILTESLLLAKL